MPLTPADVRNKQFTRTRLRSGYDEEEVDAFLDEVEVELERLAQENEQLRARLAESLRVGAAAASALNLPLAAPPPEPLEPQPATGIDKAARVLALAEQTAEQAIADASREAEDTLSRSLREADEVLVKARRQADQITSDARARAESLERDGQERHRQAMGSLLEQREEIERRVDGLRALERECRSRLQEYAEGLLRDLAAMGDGAPVPPAGTTGSQLVPSGSAHPESGNGDQAPAEGDLEGAAGMAAVMRYPPKRTSFTAPPPG